MCYLVGHLVGGVGAKEGEDGAQGVPLVPHPLLLPHLPPRHHHPPPSVLGPPHSLGVANRCIEKRSKKV